MKELGLIANSLPIDPGEVSDYTKWHYVNEPANNGAEIVTPIMSGTPEDYRLLGEVLEAVRDNGGIPNTGGHINVGTDLFKNDVAAYTHLLEIYEANADTLHRLGNHHDGQSRNISMAQPNRKPASGYASITSLTELPDPDDKYVAVNLTHVKGQRGDRVEFRFWSGSLDLAVWQARMELSRTLVNAAADASLRSKTKQQLANSKPLGAHHERARKGDAPQDNAAELAPLVELIDLLEPHLSSKAVKRQAAQLFAATDWLPDPLGTPVPAGR